MIEHWTFLYYVLFCQVLLVHSGDTVKEILTLEPDVTTPSSKNESNTPTEAVEDERGISVCKPRLRFAKLKTYDWNVWCKLQPNGNDCSGKNIFSSRYYYDTLLENCKSFLYGKCTSSYNNFNTLKDCQDTCRESGVQPVKEGNLSDKVFCRLQPEFGLCQEYHPMYYFDITAKTCKGFSYSGCGGNNNKFPTAQICSHVCLKLMEPEINY